MNFAPKELVERARKLGFEGEILVEFSSITLSSVERQDYDSGNTIEQLRVWLWEKHVIKIETTSYKELPEGFVWVYKDFQRIDSGIVNSKDPFTAELEGVTKAIEYLESAK